MKKLNVAVLLLLTLVVVGCKNATNNEATTESPKQGDMLVGDLIINGKTFQKTSGKIVIPQDNFGQVHMTDDTAWSTYYSGSDSLTKGVFLKNRNVQLNPFAMSAYEVTQELYATVMGSNPSCCVEDSTIYGVMLASEKQTLRPVDNVTWYETIAFCNELTKKTLGAKNCVYYSDEGKTTVYTKENATSEQVPFMDITKKGYRLPTEAEWEFAARGGDTTKAEWKYAYAGAKTDKAPANFAIIPHNDKAFHEVGWYWFNLSGVDNNEISSGEAGYGTHEVGLKSPNRLGLYDMSGNVSEWCWDCYTEDATSNDVAYTNGDGIVVNPLGATDVSIRIKRGGAWSSEAYKCAVSRRSRYTPEDRDYEFGFRVVRSL